MPKFIMKSKVVDAIQWFENGDHPLDKSTIIVPEKNSETRFAPFLSEGKVVRRYNHPSVNGLNICTCCGDTMNKHGWINKENFIVCPKDWVITHQDGEYDVCSPGVFTKEYLKI